MKLSHELRFGVFLLPTNPWDKLVKQIMHIEELGFDIAGSGDTFVSFFTPNESCFELWALTSAWAAMTNRIRIGMWVTAFPFRNPAFLAKQALTVDHVSNGRLELGLGSGVRSDKSYEMTGIPNWSPRQRVARFHEYVKIVDELLSNEVTDYDGRFYRIKEAIMSPRPVQKPRPPITIAAHQPRMLKLAARYADTWNTLGSAESLEEIRHRNELVDKYCREIGREPRTLRRSYVFYNHNVIVQRGLFEYYVSVDAFREMVVPFIEMGISEVLIDYPCREEQIPMFEKIACEVIPELKAEYNK